MVESVESNQSDLFGIGKNLRKQSMDCLGHGARSSLSTVTHIYYYRTVV